LAGLLSFVFFSAFFQVSDCDVGYHLRTAAHIVAGNGIPTLNTFSSATPQHPWLLHQWLGTIVFYLPFALGGVTGLITIKALVAVAIMYLTWLRSSAVSSPGSWASFWVVTAGSVAARVRFFERPDLLSALFFALLLYLDGKWDRNRRWQWLGLPLLMAAWANFHAGVIYGFALLAALIGAEWFELVSERLVHRGTIAVGNRERNEYFIRPLGFLLSLLAACLSVELINPNGWRVLLFPISQFTSKFWQSIIVEYQPPTWASERAFYLFFAALILLQAFTLKRIKWRLLLVSAGFAYLACRSQRSLLFFVIAAGPHATYMLDCLWSDLIKAKDVKRDGVPALTQAPNHAAPAGVHEPSKGTADQIGRWTPTWLRNPRRRRWATAALIGTWIAVVLAVFIPDRTFRFGVGWYHPFYPLELYRFVAKEVPPQGVFNEMRYGGSMLWWLYPRFKPFIDGRGDAYSENFWLQNYLPVLEAKAGWREMLKHFDLHCVLLPLPETGDPVPLAQTLLSDPEWALVAFNDYALLFLERTQTNSEVIARNEFKVLRPGDWSFEWVEAPDKRDLGAAEITRALGLSPESRFGRTAHVRLLMVAGQFREAAEELLRILRAYPEAGALYWRDYGYALCRMGRLEEADRVFAKMMGKHQLESYACFMRHYIALEHHEVAAADRFLSCALQFEPGNREYCLARTNLDQAMKLQQ
jgi:hypothetical protein